MSSGDDLLTRARALLSTDSEGEATVRVVQLDRARLSAAQRPRLPEGAVIEVDAVGRAYLVLEGKRLLFAASLERLLDTLGLADDALESEGASPES
jgi:hypothetical protein